MSTSSKLAIIVMGVAGSGKSTVGAELQKQTLGVFIDADDLHSPDAKAKMAGGTPLTDDDRTPWLARVSEAINDEARTGRQVIVACSALRRSYRDLLREGSSVPLFFLHLQADPVTLSERMRARSGHFMPDTLLASQFTTLEPLESGETGTSIDVRAPLNTVIDHALTAAVSVP